MQYILRRTSQEIDHRRTQQFADSLDSLTFDEICQLDRGVTTVLATIHEWRNSLANINRIPSKVLTLIATHLESQKDRFRATLVCRHWRRAFLQNPALWSRLDLGNGEVYVRTLLERTKGSALDIVSIGSPPVGVITLLPPHTKQIRSLGFSWQSWADIRRFSESNSGPLPLLHTLRMYYIRPDSSDAMIPPSLLFSSAVNLQEFRLDSRCPPLLNCFAFPNLALFELSVVQVEGFRASLLLDFLEASPILQKVYVRVIADILFDDVSRERAVVLPNLESLSLVVSDGGPGYDLVTHISCPSIKHTSLTHEKDVDNATLCHIFPAPALWNAIVRRYARSPVEKVTLEIKMNRRHTLQIGRDYTILACSLTLESPNTTVLRLCFEVTTKVWNKNEADFKTPLDEMYYGAFSEACRIIRDLPLLANVKRFYIHHTSHVSEVTPIANEVGRLFKSLGPLEELTLTRCDMRPYFTPSIVFPSIKEFAISHPSSPPPEGFEAAILRLAESQHVLGVPFESVTVEMDDLPGEMEKGLGLWVGVACCRKTSYGGE